MDVKSTSVCYTTWQRAFHPFSKSYLTPVSAQAVFVRYSSFRTLNSTWTELTVNWLLGAIQSFCKRHYHVSAILHQEARHHKVEPIQERYAYRRHFSPYSPNTLRIQILCGARGKFNLKLVAEQQDPYRRSPRQKLNRKTYQKYHGRR